MHAGNFKGRSCKMISKQPFISHIRHSLEEMAFKDIIRASSGKSKMGAFILGSCFIEYLAGFRYGKETTRDDYKNFVKEYLDKYDAEKLYADLRCKLVHNYSEGGSYDFIDARPHLHNAKLQNGKILLNLENFIADLKSALDKYFTQLESDDTLFELAVQRYKKVGLMGINKLQIKKEEKTI